MTKSLFEVTQDAMDVFCKDVILPVEAEKQFNIVVKELTSLAKLTPGHDWCVMPEVLANRLCKTSFMLGAAAVIGLAIGTGVSVYIVKRKDKKRK